MSRGVVYKCVDGKKFEKTTVQDTGNSSTVFDSGKVRHCDDGVTWYDNYPMEAIFDKYFNATWSAGFDKYGNILATKDYGDHPRAGGTQEYKGMWGFDNAAIKSFISGGEVQQMMIEVNFADPDHAGTPLLTFAPHDRKTKPNSFNFLNVWESYDVSQSFTQTGDSYSKWIMLPNGSWLDGDMGGVAVWAASNVATSLTRFSGVSELFNTRLFVKVLKDYKVKLT